MAEESLLLIRIYLQFHMHFLYLDILVQVESLKPEHPLKSDNFTFLNLRIQRSCYLHEQSKQ